MLALRRVCQPIRVAVKVVIVEVPCAPDEILNLAKFFDGGRNAPPPPREEGKLAQINTILLDPTSGRRTLLEQRKLNNNNGRLPGGVRKRKLSNDDESCSCALLRRPTTLCCAKRKEEGTYFLGGYVSPNVQNEKRWKIDAGPGSNQSISACERHVSKCLSLLHGRVSNLHRLPS